MKFFWKFFEKFVEILPFVFVFIATLYVPSDPDLGWHLKYGEYTFLHHQILRDNTFATMMPNFHWANAEWGLDFLSYVIFHYFGFLGLTLASAAIVTATFYIFAKAARLELADKVLLFPIFVYLEDPVNSVSFRGQQVSLLLIGVVFFILSRYKPFSKILFWFPVLFLFWANMHAEFFLAYAIIGVWMGITIVRNYFVHKEQRRAVYKEAGYFAFIFIFAFVVTFINPFGAGVHIDALLHFGNPLLKDINEYLPFVLLSQLWWNQVIMGILVVFSILFLYFTGRLLDSLPIMGAAFLLLGLSFEVRRYAWPAYYLIIPILLPIATFLEPYKKRNKLYFSSVLSVFSLSIIILLKWPFGTYSTTTWITYCQSGNTSCSSASAEYLRTHPALTHNLISLYGWGGWLIWNYPQIKPSIDGRMHLWVDETGYSGFSEYYDYEQNTTDIDTSKYDVVYMPPEKPIYKELEALVDAGKWSKVYSDTRSGIFVRDSSGLQ